MKPSIWTVLTGAGLLLGSVAAGAGSEPAPPKAAEPGLELATFAGGCFWCMEPPFEKLAGVVSVVSGYTDGHVTNPTYEQVSSGQTGHAEAIQIQYDPKQVSYATLLEVFWHNVDPTQVDGQFCDRGRQYRTGIYFHTDEQRRLAEASRVAVVKDLKINKPIVTEIAPASPFYSAEDYHQDFYKKRTLKYKFYRHNCGRDRRLAEVWGAAGK